MCLIAFHSCKSCLHLKFNSFNLIILFKKFVVFLLTGQKKERWNGIPVTSLTSVHIKKYIPSIKACFHFQVLRKLSFCESGGEMVNPLQLFEFCLL